MMTDRSWVSAIIWMMLLQLTTSVYCAGKAGKLLHKLGKHIASTMKEHNPNHPNYHPALGHSSSTLSSSAGSSGHGHADGHALDDAESVRLCPDCPEWNPHRVASTGHSELYSLTCHGPLCKEIRAVHGVLKMIPTTC